MKHRKFLLLFAIALSAWQVKSQTLPTMGAAASFGILAGATINTTDSVYVTGNAGAANNGGVNMIHANTFLLSPNTLISSGLSDLSSAKSSLSAQTGTTISGTLANQTLTQGVYNINTNALLHSTLLLQGDSNSIFIFNIHGDLVFDSAIVYGFHTILPSKVFWNVSGKVSMLGLNDAMGTILSAGKIEVQGLYDGTCGLLSLDSVNITNGGSSDLRMSDYPVSTYYSQNRVNAEAKDYLDNSNCPNPDYTCNLIANPGFETFRPAYGGYCPNADGLLKYTCYWESDNVIYVNNPTWGSGSPPYYIGDPELFAENSNCTQQSNSTDFDIPNNKYNNLNGAGQPAHTGHNYAGIEYSFKHAADSQNDGNGPPPYTDVYNDERLEKQLPAPLTPNVVYYMEFYASLADKSNITTKLSVYPGHASTNPYYIGPPVYDPSPNPFFTSQANITSNANWTRVSGCVSTPSNNVQWVCIRADYASPRVPVTSSDPSIYSSYPQTGQHKYLYKMAYFYIDDVLLRPLANAGADQNLHCQNSAIIGETSCQPIAGAVYAWSAADGFTSTNAIIGSPSGMNTHVTFNAPGHYVFNLTVTLNGCTATDQVVVYTDIPQVTVSSASGSCPNTQTTLTASGGSHGATYIWNPGNYTGSSYTVNPASPTVYTVSIYDGGCMNTATVLINPVFCCKQGTELTATTISSMTSGIYSLNHPLTVTADMSMTGVTIFMGTNAELIIANNVKLSMINVHLLGCPNMWKGIRAIGPNATISTLKNVMIEDAITAIDVKAVTAPKSGQSLILDIQDALFNKNFTGIDAENYSSSSADYPASIQNTVFTCRKMITPDHSTYLGQGAITFNWPTLGSASLKNTNYNPVNGSIQSGVNVTVNDEFTPASGTLYPSINLSQPHSGDISRQGIYLYGVGYTNEASSIYRGFTLNAGTTYTTMNLFDNMIYGIYAINSNVKSSNAAYQEMNQYSVHLLPKLPVYFGGVGIYSENTNTFLINPNPNKLTVLPGVSPATYDKSGNFFFNNPYGIKTVNVSYTDIEYAMIHSKRTYPPSLQAVGQALKGDYGIFIKTSDYRDIEVKNNIAANLTNAITFQADYKAYNSEQRQYVGSVVINRNLLEANYPATQGTTSMYNAIVADNLINCSTCGAYNGNTSTSINTTDNTIKNVFRGIKSSNWQKQVVSANTNTITLSNETAAPSSTQFGISHQNNDGDNVVGNYVTGFGVSKTTVSAILSQDNKAQTNSCNHTSSTYEGFTFSGSQNLTNWRNNNMISHVRGMHLKNTVIGQQGTVSDPIGDVWQLGGSGWSSSNYQTYVTSSAPTTAANYSKLYVNTGTTTDPIYNGEASANTKYAAPGTIVISTGTNHYLCPFTFPHSGVFPTIASFFTPELMASLDDIVSNNIPYINYPTSMQENSKRSVYRMLLQDPSIASGDATLQNFMATSSGSNMDAFETVEGRLFNGDNVNAQSTNSSLSPQGKEDINAQSFYDIYLKSKSGTYDDTDDNTLLMLAKGCPDRDGLVVYQARVLYNSVHETFQYFEDSCDVTGQHRTAANSSSFGSAGDMHSLVKVYPNPSTGNFVIDIREAKLNSMTLKVYDVNGRMIYAQDVKELTSEVYKLDLDAQNGIYLLEISDGTKGVQYRQKLIINQ